jgi:hypothetical protein
MSVWYEGEGGIKERMSKRKRKGELVARHAIIHFPFGHSKVGFSFPWPDALAF